MLIIKKVVSLIEAQERQRKVGLVPLETTKVINANGKARNSGRDGR